MRETNEPLKIYNMKVQLDNWHKENMGKKPLELINDILIIRGTKHFINGLKQICMKHEVDTQND